MRLGSILALAALLAQETVSVEMAAMVRNLVVKRFIGIGEINHTNLRFYSEILYNFTKRLYHFL